MSDDLESSDSHSSPDTNVVASADSVAKKIFGGIIRFLGMFIMISAASIWVVASSFGLRISGQDALVFITIIAIGALVHYTGRKLFPGASAARASAGGAVVGIAAVGFVAAVVAGIIGFIVFIGKILTGGF
jgi:hypothetical protein